MHDHLIEFATQRELDFIEAIKKYGSGLKAAEALGLNRRTVDKGIKRLKERAAKRSPQEHNYTKTVPIGYAIKGVSQYVKDGEVKGQWVKTTVDHEAQQKMLETMVETMCSDLPKLPVIAPPVGTYENLLNVIPMGDPHFGLYAWAQESGDDFSVDIAKQLTLGAVDRLLVSAPNAKTCCILPLGDIFHANDQSNVTPAHRHQLDVDTRYQRVMMIGVLTFRHVIIRALEKHENVVVRFVKGNHDPEASFGLALATASFFHDNPRVKVDLSPSDFWYYRHGKTLIGATHGDKVKHEQLLGVMATDRAEDWGQTKHRYWLTGHVHSQQVREYFGVTCESFRTLAAKDAYASGHGYRAGRDMRCITYHIEHGEIERHRVDVGML
jgi:hypothetical protein